MPETTRVRILVAIDSSGKWVSAGYGGSDDQNDPKEWIILDDLNEIIAYRWIEADVALPISDTVVAGEIFPDMPDEVEVPL